jgi:hypothetical protein
MTKIFFNLMQHGKQKGSKSDNLRSIRDWHLLSTARIKRKYYSVHSSLSSSDTIIYPSWGRSSHSCCKGESTTSNQSGHLLDMRNISDSIHTYELGIAASNTWSSTRTTWNMWVKIRQRFRVTDGIGWEDGQRSARKRRSFDGKEGWPAACWW